MADVRKLLITMFKITKSQTEAMRDLSAQVQAIYDYLEGRDQDFAAKFSTHEAESLADPLFGGGSSASLKLIDQVIDALERGEPLNL